MARKSQNISILQFDAQQISRLRVKPSAKGVDVLAWDTQQGPWSMEDGVLDKALQAFVKEHRVADDAVYAILPRHEVTTRILNLPSHDGEEFMYVLDGRMRYWLAGTPHDLDPGDSIHFVSSTPHYLENPGAEKVLILWVGSFDIFSENP